MTDFLTLSYTSTREVPTVSFTRSVKKLLLSGGASRIGHYKEYPPTPPQTSGGTI